MKLSAEQQRAVERQGQDVCVVAGPGSGKTRVLIERFAWLIEHQDMDPQRILAITFTEKAATEIKERLIRRFADNPSLRPKIERAWVSTIHGFCARLLREHAIDAGVAPDFAVLDAPAAWELERQAATEALESLYREQPEALGRLLDSLSAGTQADSDRSPDLAALLVEVQEALRAAGATLPDRETEPAYLPEIRLRIAQAKGQRISGTPAQRETQARFDAWASEFLALPETATVAHLGALENYPVRRPKRDTAVASIHPLIQDEWPGCVLADLYAPQRRLLLEALKRFQSLFREKKDRQGALDFGDLEERTIALLKVNTVLRETVCGRFEQVLIDELQDTNRLQWELFSLLRRHGRFFAVGDINQSIYGFRHAEPELFARYREELEKAGLAVDALRGNYRSRAGILQAVDALLKGEAGIEERELEAKAEYPAGSEPCVEILCGQGKSAVEAEASLIAARIRELAGRLLVGQDSPRPAQLLDMAILVRSFAAMDPVTRALDAAGIPYRVNAGRTFLEARETLDLQLLLAVIANPRDSLALAGVMRSPLVGLRDESIFRHVEGLPIADAAEQRRYQQFFNLLNWARAHRDSVAPDAMLAAFLDESGYEARLPERARANVEKFLALLAGLHRRQPRDPAQLLDYLNTLRGAASEAEAPPAEAGNMISVLTFHAAKGLEWPVVFVAALHRRADGSRPSIDFLPDFGLGFRWRGSKPGSSHGDPVWRRIRERWRRRNREEENRLLYVAMTRAKERLILSYSETKQRAEIARRLAEVTRLPDALRVSAAVPVTATAADGREDGVQEEVLARWQASPSPESVMAVTEIAGAFEFAGWRPRQALETGVSAHEWIAKALAGQCPDEDNPAARLGRRFLESDLGRRALAAPRREVEFDFLYAPGPTLVRGQIDLWFEDSRGLVLVDYKTNRQLDSPNLDRYQEQLRQYAAALKAYLARPVTEAWLFDLRQGIAVAVPLPAETQ